MTDHTEKEAVQTRPSQRRGCPAPKNHCLNPAPQFTRPPKRKRRPHLLDLAELRSRYVHVDRLPHWAALRAHEHMRANTREERERAFRAFFGAVFHAVDIVSGRVWGSQAFLAAQCGLNPSRVSRLVEAAKACGYLKVYTLFDNPHEPEKRRTILYVQDRLYQDMGFTEAEIRKERAAAKDRREKEKQQPRSVVQGIKIKEALDVEKRRERHRQGPAASFGFAAQARRKAEAATQRGREQSAREALQTQVELMQYYLDRGFSSKEAIERTKADLDALMRRQSA